MMTMLCPLHWQSEYLRGGAESIKGNGKRGERAWRGTYY